MTEPEIIDAEVVQSDLSATEQKQIDKALAEIKKAEVLKVNKIDLAISQLQEKYLAINITGLADRDAYLTAKDGHKLVREHRLAVERKRKELVEFPNKYLKAVNGEATRIKELLTPIEEHLKLQVGIFEEAEEAEKTRLAGERRAKFLEAGFKFDGNFYVCGIHTVPASTLGDMDDEKVAYYIKEAEQIIALEKAAEERRQAELKAQQEAAQKLEADRKALAAEREAFAKQQADAMAAMEKMRKDMEAMRAQILGQQPPAPETVKVEAPVVTATEVSRPGMPIYDGPPAPAPVAPAHLDNADLVDAAIEESGFSQDYVLGFEACREKTIALLMSPEKRTRQEFVELIKLFSL